MQGSAEPRFPCVSLNRRRDAPLCWAMLGVHTALEAVRAGVTTSRLCTGWVGATFTQERGGCSGDGTPDSSLPWTQRAPWRKESHGEEGGCRADAHHGFGGDAEPPHTTPSRPATSDWSEQAQCSHGME